VFQSLPKYERAQRRWGMFFIFLYLFNTLMPSAFASAQVMFIAKNGYGVARIQLPEMSFDNPGFGEVSQAVNVANGNVYVAASSFSRNKAGDDNNFGTWQFTPKLKLQGYSKIFDWTRTGAPFTLMSGDGSQSVFQRVVPDACIGYTGVPRFALSATPSWVKRYTFANATEACDKWAFYRLQADPNLSYHEEWVVLAKVPSTVNVIAHYYTADGTRYTFYNDGEYADYSQTLYEQYQGAKNDSDSEGINASSPKTQFVYTNATEGKISQITDAYGRTTSFTWENQFLTSATFNVLKRVNYLGNDTTAARSVSFTYDTVTVASAVRPVIKTVAYSTYATPTGTNTSSSKTFSFIYKVSGNDVLLETVSEPKANGSSVTTYRYNATNQLTGFSQSGLPDTTYDYSGTSIYGGALVKVTQGEKYSEYHFEVGTGKLRKRVVRDINANPGGATRDLEWLYAYHLTGDGAGNLGVMKDPAGKVTYYGYDSHGNLFQEAVFDDLNYFRGLWIKPPTVRLSMRNQQVGLEEKFFVTATVEYDTNKTGYQGVEWLLNSSTGSVFTQGQTLGGVKLESAGQPVCSGTPLVCVQTATFIAPTTVGTFSIYGRANALKDTTVFRPEQNAQAFDGIGVQVEYRVETITLKTATNTLYIGPNCIRPLSLMQLPGAFNTLQCEGTTSIFTADVKLWNWFEQQIDNDSTLDANAKLARKNFYKSATFEVSGWNYADLGNAYKPYFSNGQLVVPWRGGLGRRSTTIDIVAKSSAVNEKDATGQVKTSHPVTLTLKFFDMEKSTSGIDSWDSPDPAYLHDGGAYKFGVELINRLSADTGVAYSVTDSYGRSYTSDNRRSPVGFFGGSYGCLQINEGNLGINQRYPGIVTARATKFSDYVFVSGAFQSFGYLGLGEPGMSERCYGSVAPDPNQGTVLFYPEAANAALLVRNTPVGFMSLVKPFNEASNANPFDPNPEQYNIDLPKVKPNANEVYYQEYSYDTDNRLTSSKQASPRYTQYADVLDNLVYTNYTAPAAVNGQTFTVTNTVTTSRMLRNNSTVTTSIEGLAPQASLAAAKRTTVDTYLENGNLSTSQLTWDGGTRTSTYSYYAATEAAISLNFRSATYSVKQYPDWVKSVAVTEAGKTRTQTFVYDRLGNPVRESLVDVASDVNTTGVFTYNTRTIERAFNGYGQQLWEQSKLGTAVASEQGWLYLPTGEPANSWIGSPQNLTTYSYYSGVWAGVLASKKYGLGDGTWSLTTPLTKVRQQTDYDYDSFLRVSKETFVLGATGNTSNRYYYDTLDRERSRIVDGQDSYTYYDLTGGVSERQEAKIVYQYVHDVMGYLITERILPKVGPANTRTYINDPLGRVISVANSDVSINPGAEPANDADTSKQRFVYDSEGNLLCEVGPTLRGMADPNAFKDRRRPGKAYTYDNLGRKTSESTIIQWGAVYNSYCKLMPNGIVPSNASADVAGTTFAYGSFDEISTITDATGYTTKMSYDAAGQVIATSQEITKGSTTDVATTNTVYDAAGRVVKVRDPESNISRTEYNAAGQVTKEIDARGYTTKRYTYTPEGLLATIEEPVMSSGDAQAKLPGDATLTFEITQINSYGDLRPWPIAVYKAAANATPLTGTSDNPSGGVKTSYTYNYRGQPLTTIIADGTTLAATITQTYDFAGNLLTLTDADGYTTTYAYDYANRITSESRAPKTDTPTVDTPDELAGFRTPLVSSYTYDAFGNLVEQNKQGLITKYVYNSIGKVIAESQSYVAGASSVLYKKYAYRLDGLRVAETSYDVTDSGAGDTLAVKQGEGELVNVTITKGATTIYRFDKMGRPAYETRRNVLAGQGGATNTEITFTTNGLGLVTRRDFRGDSSIYDLPRNPSTGANLSQSASSVYSSAYTYDKRGLLLTETRTVPISSVDATYETYDYTYTATGKEKTSTRSVTKRVERSYVEANVTKVEPLVVAASIGTVTNDYNERDLLQKTTTVDRAALGSNGVQADPSGFSAVTTYSYYSDGHKKQNKATSGNVDYSYDARGRVATVVDSNGAWTQLAAPTTTQLKAATTTTSYVGNVVTEKADWGTCSVTKTTTYVMGSYAYIDNTADTCTDVDFKTKVGLKTRTTKVTTQYENGRPKSSTTEVDSDAFVQRAREVLVTYETDTLETYNTLGNLSESKITRKETAPSVNYNDANGNSTSTGSSNKTDVVTTTPNYTPTQIVGGETTSVVTTGLQFGANVASSSNTTTTYQLDGFGNRLGVTSKVTKYNGSGTVVSSNQPAQLDGYIKRYSAEGQVASFYYVDTRPYLDVNNTQRNPAFGQAAYSYFVYDPKGNMVVSSNSVTTNTQTAPRRLARDFSSTYSSNGEVQVIRKSNSDYNVAVQGQYTDTMQVYSPTFSMADGLKANTQWQAAVLFDFVPENTTTLEAPTESISDTLGVSPLDVAPPGDLVPSTGDEEVAIPTDGQEETPAPVDGEVEVPVASEEPTSQAVTTTSFDVSAPLIGLSDLNAPASQTTTTSETSPMQTEEIVLPETIKGINTLDIAAPVNSEVPTTPELPASDSTEVAAPGQVDEAPSLGNLPSDSSLDIAAPQTLEARVPPIESAPSPLEVAPPEGFALDDGDIGVFQTGGNIDVECRDLPKSDGSGTYRRCFRVSNDVDEAANNRLLEIENDLGGDLDDTKRSQLVAEAMTILGYKADLFTEELIGLQYHLTILDGSRQVEFISMLQQALDTGQMDGEYLESISYDFTKMGTSEVLDHLEIVEGALRNGAEFKGKQIGDTPWVRRYGDGTLMILNGLLIIGGEVVMRQGRPIPVESAITVRGSLSEAATLQARAYELNGTVPNRKGTTVAVAKVRNVVTGEEQVWIARNGIVEEQAAMRQARWELRSNERYVTGRPTGESEANGLPRDPHAEENILNATKGTDWVIESGGASRNICITFCSPRLQADGLMLDGPNLNPYSAPDKTPFSMFYRP
jgi:YD repeat-containing protein